MSLGIAKIIDGEICINADSLMSGNDVVRHDVRKHCVLKCVLITQNVCLIYAGNIEPVSQLIKQVYSIGNFSFKKLVDIIFDNHQKYDKSTDYILAAYLNNTPFIVEIKDGILTKENQTSWVGSKRAFASFQEKFYTEKENSNNIRDTFRNSFKTILDMDEFPEIGSFLFTINTIQYNGLKLLNYQPRIEMNVTFSDTDLREMGYVDSSDSTRANGGFSVTYIPAVQKDNTGIGLHFGHVDFGLLFSPRIYGIYPKSFNNVSGSDFAKCAKDEGIILGGLVFDAENNILTKV